jgi:hypothetical protein
MDLSEYLVIEETAAARVDDLHEDAASQAPVEIPALRGPLFKWDVRKRIDDAIDYFGDPRRDDRSQSVGGCW